MSTLDQALIRAYGSGAVRATQPDARADQAGNVAQSPDGSAPSAIEPPVGEQGCMWVLPPHLSFASCGAETKPSPPPGNETIRIDAGGPAKRPVPHFAVAEQLPIADPSLDRPPSAAPEPAGPSGNRRASGRSADDQLAPPDRAMARRLSPAWEVDRIQWPELCDRLAQRDPSALAAAGKRLLAAGPARILVLTSCVRGEGRTTVALCLARSAAAAGARLLLADGDFRNPQIGSALSLEVPHGWEEAIGEKLPLAESMVLSVKDQLALLLLSRRAARVDLASSAQQIRRLLRSAAGSFDLLLVDGGPLAQDGVDLLAAADGVVLVRDAGRTRGDELDRAVGRLQRRGIEVIGIVENFGLGPQ